MTTAHAIGFLVGLLAIFVMWSSARVHAAAIELSQGVRRALAALVTSPPPDLRRPCPTCGGASRLLCGVEPKKNAEDFDVNEDDFRLWECHAHGCFDVKGKQYGQRRVCVKCGHREGPTGEESCGCVVHIPAPCCATIADVEELDVKTGKVTTKRKAVGRCTYSEPRTMEWSPEAKV